MPRYGSPTVGLEFRVSWEIWLGRVRVKAIQPSFDSVRTDSGRSGIADTDVSLAIFMGK
jgi:hypothetical protein